MKKVLAITLCAVLALTPGCRSEKTNEAVVEPDFISIAPSESPEEARELASVQSNSSSQTKSPDATDSIDVLSDDARPFEAQDALSNDINFNMSEQDVRAKLGDPQESESETAEVTGDITTTLTYSSIIVEFVRPKDSSKNALFAFHLLDSSLTGPRSIRVGDSELRLKELFSVEDAQEDGLIYGSGEAPGMSEAFVLPPYALLSTEEDGSKEYSFVAPNYTDEELVANNYEYMFLPHYTLTVTVRDSIVSNISIYYSVFAQ